MALKRVFSQFSRLLNSAKDVYSNLYLLFIKKLIAHATIQGCSGGIKTPRERSDFDAICAICTNRTQASLFLDPTLLYVCFFILFLLLFTFYNIIFLNAFFRVINKKHPLRTLASKGDDGCIFHYLPFV